ncbi:MAG: hypothetical protein AB7E96_09795 [Deferribacterales bacterium]
MTEKKKNNPRTIKLNTTMDVAISRGAMEYAAGIDPAETWEVVTGENQNLETMAAMRKKHAEQVQKAEGTKEYVEKMDDFLKEAVRLFQGIMSGNADIIRPYIAGKKFHFILGMPRTGGTTIYNAASSAYGWEWNKLLVSMTHNYMPNAIFVQNNPYVEYDMGWRLPWNFNNLLFELCQFLTYVNREATDKEHVFLKSTPLSYSVKLLNFLFADRAEYLVTVRHPGAIALTKGTGKEITREDHIEVTTMWANLYSSIIRECRPVGRITVVPYGESMTKYLNELFEFRKIGQRLEDTSFFEFEDYDKDFYDSEQVQKAFKYVKDSWALFDIDFPIPDKCI